MLASAHYFNHISVEQPISEELTLLLIQLYKLTGEERESYANYGEQYEYCRVHPAD